MHFDDSPEEAAYRTEVRAWLTANAPQESFPMHSPKRLAQAREWQRVKAESGYTGFGIAPEYGGAGASMIEQVIFEQEEARIDAPSLVFEVTLGMCLPTINHCGTEHQKQRYLRRGLRGEDLWCQLFSEPAGGSDLAAARTRAERDGDGWRVTGQKVWTTMAHWADHGLLLARTDPGLPKHRGLTMFLVDMKSPGVEVRPIRQINGESEFNEVFFDDVRIADSDRIGAIGEGWKVAISTLMFERYSLGGDPDMITIGDLAGLVRRTGNDSEDARARLAEWSILLRGVSLLNARAQSAMSKGEVPGPEQSVKKLVSCPAYQQMAYFALDLVGTEAVMAQEGMRPMHEELEYAFYWSAANRIAGGSDEILRNIIAERVLGLPPGPKEDRTLPFNQSLG